MSTLYCLRRVIFMKRNNVLKYFMLFIFSFIISFFFVYVLMPTFCDEIWTYGFSYNISKGMIIYRDFNVLQTPLYFFIGACFIKIFGAYMLSLAIFNSILYAIMVVMLYKIKGSAKLILFSFIFIWYPSSYNLFLLFLSFLIIYLIYTKKDNDIVIAILVSLIFLTKQNIGIVMLIPCLYYSKNKIKSISAFLIPCLILVIYLVYNGTLFNFIDYCFLGLFDFNSDNNSYDFLVFIIWIFCCLYLLFLLIKCRFRDKICFYILCFQFMAYPIVDIRHFSAVFFLFFCFLDINYNIYLKILVNILKYTFVVVYMIISLSMIDYSKISFDNSNYLYLKNTGDSILSVNHINNYLERINFNSDVDYVFLGEYYGYFYKLYYNIPISNYDFFMTGNMGYYNKSKLYNQLKEICENNRCYFILNKICFLESNQWHDFAYYIDNNYTYIDKIDDMRIYTSKS